MMDSRISLATFLVLENFMPLYSKGDTRSIGREKVGSAMMCLRKYHYFGSGVELPFLLIFIFVYTTRILG